MATLTQATLDIHLDEVYKEVDRRKDEVLDVIYDEVRANTPVDTGALRDSTYINRSSNVVGQTKEYGPYVEYKTNYFSQAVINALSECKQIWQG